MADVRIIARRAGVSNPKLESKTAEYVRLVNSRLSGATLGQGELCKTAACMELASLTLDVPLDASLLRKCSGVSEQVYKNTKAMLQKLLGVGSKATARDLCIQFGCARHESAVKAALTAYKERFVRRLPPAKQGHVDFGRPVFLAAAFYLAARKNKTQVDKSKLLQPLGIMSKEFAEVLASMTDLIPDLVGTAADKKRSGSSRAQQSGGANRELLDATGGSDDDDEDCSSDEEEVTEEGMVGQRINKKKQRQREFEEWKEKVMVAEAPKAKKQKLSEKSLRQATLSFAAGAGKEGAASQEAKGGEAARAPGAQALQQKNK